MTFKKAYYLLFYKLYQAVKTTDDGIGLNDWKAGLIVQTLQYFILFSVVLQVEILSHKSVFPEVNPMIWAIPIAIFLAVFNYYAFLHNDKWKKYESEFISYPKPKMRISNIIVIFICFFIIVLLIFTFYQYSQVDWKKYE